MCHDTFYQAHDLRAKNMNVMMTAIAVLIAMLFISALLPTLLVRYIYAGQQLFEQPKLLEYIPIVSFVVGVGYFLLAIVGNCFRAKRIKYLTKQASMKKCCSDTEMMTELETLATTIAKKSPKKKSLKKKTTAKTKTKK